MVPGPVRALALFAVAAILLAACSDLLVDSERLAVEATGTIHGLIYLDQDGSGSMTGPDDPVEGVRMLLVSAGSGSEVQAVETDGEGVFSFPAAPVGEFRLVPDSASVPDSVQVFDLDEEPFVLAWGDTVQRTLRLSYPTYTLEEIQELEPGQRVFTQGIALNARVPFGDGVVHLRDGEFFLRSLSVDRMGLQPGDSLRFQGRTAIDQGRPVLEDVRPFMLQPSAQLVQPEEVSSEDAASADGGRLDAALVRIRDAVIQDTIPMGNHLTVVADDGSGPVDVFLRDFLQISREGMTPDSAQFDRAAGLLVPVEQGDGSLRWRLLPRGSFDIAVSELEFEEEEEEEEENGGNGGG